VIPAGARNALVIFQRAETSTNSYNELVEDGIVEVTRAMARIKFGTAQEKRQAAQEVGVQAATFECVRTPKLEGIIMSDRISFDGALWDITEIAPLDRQTIRFTGARNR
jgi:hypothetical protein